MIWQIVHLVASEGDALLHYSNPLSPLTLPVPPGIHNRNFFNCSIDNPYLYYIEFTSICQFMVNSGQFHTKNPVYPHSFHRTLGGHSETRQFVGTTGLRLRHRHRHRINQQCVALYQKANPNSRHMKSIHLRNSNGKRRKNSSCKERKRSTRET